MKQTIHKLLCMLLVLTMLCSLAPAVLADEEPGTPGEGEHTHTMGYVSNNNGTHTYRCTTCDDVTGAPTACTKGVPNTWVENTQSHTYTCTECGYVGSDGCTLAWQHTTTGHHKQVCLVCGHEYVAETECTDSNTDGKCDVCGADMPAEETPIVRLDRSAIQASQQVNLGTELNLGTSIMGKTAAGEEVSCTVGWDYSGYDKNKIGTYTITGTVTVPDGYVLAEGVSATITVTVKVVGDYTLRLSAGSSMTVGDTLSISATVTKREGATDASNLKIVWSVDDPTGQIAALSNENTAVFNNAAANRLTAVSSGASTSYKNVTVTAILKSGDAVLDTESTTVRIYPATASVIKVNAAGGGVTFGESAFYSALGYGLGGKLDYVTFDLPASSKGTLYSDNTRYRTALPRVNKCYYDPRYTSNVIDLDTVYFEVAETYTTSPITLTYTAYNSDNNVIANGSIDVSLLTSTIRYDVDAEGMVTFDEDDFRSVLRASYSGAALDYVQFDMSNAVFGNAYGGSSKYGYLYIDSGLKTKLTASNDSAKFAYNYKSSSSRYYYDLDDVTYVAGSATGKYTVTVPFTAYGTGNYQYVTGVVEIVVDETDAFTIGCTGTDFSAVTREIANTYKNATYIMFDLPEQGTLYYDFDAINNYGHKVRSNYAYYLEASAKDEYDLDDVWFVPAAGQTKARISFDVYSGKTKIDSGSITFSIKGRTSSQVFTDVTYANTGSWSADSIDFMYANGLIYGTGKNKFSPNATMTRGDLVLILYRLAGEPSVSGVKNPFKDVTSGDYYYKAVLWAYKNDVVNGTGNGTFSPKKAVTREQLAAILYRYSGAPSTSTRLTGFTDASKVSSYATNAMKWAVGAGIINGNGNKLDPQSSATRAQVAAMLHRYLTK